MAHFQLYIPGVSTPDPQQLKPLGLSDLIVGAGFQHCPSGFTTGERGWLPAGSLVKWTPGEPDDSWHWTPSKQRGDQTVGAYYVGWPSDSQPTPSDLDRSSDIVGNPVQLADGHVWIIPAARQLPRRWTLNEQGLPIKVPHSAFDEFFTRAAECFDRLSHATRGDLCDQSFVLGGEWELACMALALKYRIAPPIVDLLGLLDHATMLQVVGAAFEIFDLAEIVRQKKTDLCDLAGAIESIWHGEAA